MMADKPTPRTAVTLAAFAKELDDEGFSEAAVQALVVVALQHELRTEGLWVGVVDG